MPGDEQAGASYTRSPELNQLQQRVLVAPASSSTHVTTRFTLAIDAFETYPISFISCFPLLISPNPMQFTSRPRSLPPRFLHPQHHHKYFEGKPPPKTIYNPPHKSINKPVRANCNPPPKTSNPSTQPSQSGNSALARTPNSVAEHSHPDFALSATAH